MPLKAVRFQMPRSLPQKPAYTTLTMTLSASAGSVDSSSTGAGMPCRWKPRVFSQGMEDLS